MGNRVMVCSHAMSPMEVGSSVYMYRSRGSRGKGRREQRMGTETLGNAEELRPPITINSAADTRVQCRFVGTWPRV